MAIELGENASPDDFIETSAGAGDAGKVPKLNASGQLDQSFHKKPIRRTYTYGPPLGASNSQFDITRPGTPNANTTRYTWDGNGTDPGINSTTFPVGARVWIKINSAGNSGEFIVTASGANYFEITNASGTAESNKTLSDGFLRVFKDVTWTKPAGLSHAEIEVQAPGGGSRGSDTSTGTNITAGGGSGGYARRLMTAAELGSTETVQVGAGGLGSSASSDPDPATAGGTSAFGSHITCTGGSPSAGTQGVAGGTATGGDINIEGSRSQSVSSTSQLLGAGADSMLGKGGINVSNVPQTPPGYGGGAAGAADDAQGGDGAPGIIIVTEYY